MSPTQFVGNNFSVRKVDVHTILLISCLYKNTSMNKSLTQQRLQTFYFYHPTITCTLKLLKFKQPFTKEQRMNTHWTPFLPAQVKAIWIINVTRVLAITDLKTIVNNHWLCTQAYEHLWTCTFHTLKVCTFR